MLMNDFSQTTHVDDRADTPRLLAMGFLEHDGPSILGRLLKDCVKRLVRANNGSTLNQPRTLELPNAVHLTARLVLAPLVIWLLTAEASGQTGASTVTATNEIRVISKVGKAELSRDGKKRELLVNELLRPGDHVHTGEYSELNLSLFGRSIWRMKELTEMKVGFPDGPEKRTVMELLRGMLYFFHRDRPDEFELRAPAVSAIIRGTEFTVKVEENGRTVLDLLDGKVEMSAHGEHEILHSGERGIAEPGTALRKTALIAAKTDLVQWFLYYPAVLDIDELELTGEERRLLQDSLSAYRSGDLMEALRTYPAERQPVSASRKLYLAALSLAVGQVEKSETSLLSLEQESGFGERQRELAQSLRQLIAAVKFKSWPETGNPELATSLMAASYFEQSRGNLPEALRLASSATKRSPNFGFAWARVAELEFGHGRVPEARRALRRALESAPLHAEAFALDGFLSSAENRITKAIASFDRAIVLDGALGNAWLGRGLCKIRQGKTEAGREDLLMAAALEPQRALLRSYLAKAFSDEGDSGRAAKEIELAKSLDENDPTAFLYSALLHEQENRVNKAVRELEKSVELNKNRRLYRSQQLLDQDRAVREMNLANIYRDAGMFDLSVREAARAVSADYANYSAHLFLANSYSAIADPNFVNLRYETPAEAEYLVANLLAPVGAGALSPTVSQNEYSKLFERDGLGIAASTEYLSRGSWNQSGAQYGTFGNMSYAVDSFYLSENGQRPNNDLDLLQLSFKMKQQLTPLDSAYLQAIYSSREGGDLLPNYLQMTQYPNLRFEEKQEPILVAGYHHEWQPGSHTLVLFGRLQDTHRVTNPDQAAWQREFFGDTPGAIYPVWFDHNYRSELKIYAAEAQQIWQQDAHRFICGLRYQAGDIDTTSTQRPAPQYISTIDEPIDQAADSSFTRWGAYAYYQWQLAPPFSVIGGISYDWIEFPSNFRIPPISDSSEKKDKISPKAGFVWTPSARTAVRGAFTRSLQGASFDQSFRLEPTQVAGFNQAYRSIIPESVAASTSGADFETWSASFEQQFGSGTYLGVSAELLRSELDRAYGIYDYARTGDPLVAVPRSTTQRIDYRERSVTLDLNQLLGACWSLGARYRLSDVHYTEAFPEIPDLPDSDPSFSPAQQRDATLHRLNLYAFFNHASGFFSEVGAVWTAQSNRGYSPDQPGDQFWQFNAQCGYRFSRRRAELRIGLLNLADQDYNLNPLNLATELPRSRTFAASFRFNFR